MFYFFTISTLLFFARFSSASLDATGARGPTPYADKREEAIPYWPVSAAVTALARASDNVIIVCKITHRVSVPHKSDI